MAAAGIPSSSRSRVELVGSLRAERNVGVLCLKLSHLDETEIRAYILANVELAEKFGWDCQHLAIELESPKWHPEMGLDIGIIVERPL